MEGNYINGKKEGLFTKYSYDGDKECEFFYKEGLVEKQNCEFKNN